MDDFSNLYGSRCDRLAFGLFDVEMHPYENLVPMNAQELSKVLNNALFYNEKIDFKNLEAKDFQDWKMSSSLVNPFNELISIMKSKPNCSYSRKTQFDECIYVIRVKARKKDNLLKLNEEEMLKSPIIGPQLFKPKPKMNRFTNLCSFISSPKNTQICESSLKRITGESDCSSEHKELKNQVEGFQNTQDLFCLLNTQVETKNRESSPTLFSTDEEEERSISPSILQNTWNSVLNAERETMKIEVKNEVSNESTIGNCIQIKKEHNFDNNVKIKSELKQNFDEAPSNFSTIDEVIVLDSDEEDFPCSQLDSTMLGDVPDYGGMLNRLFDADLTAPETTDEKPFVDTASKWFQKFIKQDPDKKSSESRYSDKHDSDDQHIKREEIRLMVPHIELTPLSRDQLPQSPQSHCQQAPDQHRRSSRKRQRHRSAGSVKKRVTSPTLQAERAKRLKELAEAQRAPQIEAPVIPAPVVKVARPSRSAFLTEELKQKRPIRQERQGPAAPKEMSNVRRGERNGIVDGNSIMRDQLDHIFPKKSCLRTVTVKRCKKVAFEEHPHCHTIPELTEEDKKWNFKREVEHHVNRPYVEDCKYQIDLSIQTICSWNCVWLEEQQNNMRCPPVYRYSSEEMTELEKYENILKLQLFESVWMSIFLCWRDNNNRIFPDTQYCNNEEANNVMKIEIIKVQSPNLKKKKNKEKNKIPLWALQSTSELDENKKNKELKCGDVCLLNYKIEKHSNNFIKTRVFAYVYTAFKLPKFGGFIQHFTLLVDNKQIDVPLQKAKILILENVFFSLRRLECLTDFKTAPVSELFLTNATKENMQETFKRCDINLNASLDRSQREAVALCLNSLCETKATLGFVAGSSGTGKTEVVISTLCEMFSQRKRSFFQPVRRVLVICSSTYAVNDMLGRIRTISTQKNLRINMVRIIPEVTSELEEYDLSRKVEKLVSSDDGKQLYETEIELRNLEATVNCLRLTACNATKEETMQNMCEQLQYYERRLKELKEGDTRAIAATAHEAMTEHVLANTQVVVTTTNGVLRAACRNIFVPSATNLGSFTPIDACIFDDAHLVRETLSSAVAVSLRVRHVIAVGDLGNEHAKISSNGWFYNNATHPCNRMITAHLDVQHRMHPETMDAAKNWSKSLRCERKQQNTSPFKIRPYLVIDQRIGNLDELECLAILCCKLVKGVHKLVGRKSILVYAGTQQQKDVLNQQLNVHHRRSLVRLECLSTTAVPEHEIVIIFITSDTDECLLYPAFTKSTQSLILCGDFSTCSGPVTKRIYSEEKSSNRLRILLGDPARTASTELSRFLSAKPNNIGKKIRVPHTPH